MLSLFSHIIKEQNTGDKTHWHLWGNNSTAFKR